MSVRRDFRLLWMGDTVSVFGNAFAAFAIPLIAVRLLHAGALQMGILSALETAAFLLISLPAGAWVDRMRKKRVIVVGDLLRAGLLLTIPLAWAAGVLTFAQLCAVAAAVGVVTVFFDIANQSYLPEIVESDWLGTANGRLQASQQTAAVAGPSLASGLIGLIGGPLTVGATSVCMALSSLFVSRIRHREDTPSAAGRPRLVAEIREGLAFVLGHPILRRIVLCTGMANCASAAASALLVLYALGPLGLSPFELSLVMSGGALGGVLGALSAGWAQRVLGEGRAIAVAASLAGTAPLLLPAASWLPPLPTMVAAWSAMSWAAVLYNVTQVSFRQRLCPKPLLGRMNASIRFLVWGPMPLGGLAAGLLGHACGLVPTLWIFAGVAVCTALPVLLSPLANMRTLPAGLDVLDGD